MGNNLKPEYNCAQKDLYSILETAWMNYDDHQAEFATFKGLYTTGLSTAAKEAIDTARALPDDQARGEASETLRLTLVEQGKTCRKHFQALKSYIASAYEGTALQKIKCDAAGQNYYSDASNEDWESVELMNQSMMNFIAANATTLAAGDNMPDSFGPMVTDDANAFKTTYNNYKEEEQTSEETSAKIAANNACYRSGMSMMKDGQVIFADNDAVLVKFIFQSLHDLIDQDTTAVEVTVKDAATNELLADAEVALQFTDVPDKVKNTDESGVALFSNVVAGTYRVKVQKSGYVTQAVEGVLVAQGVTKKVEVKLVEAP